MTRYLLEKRRGTREKHDSVLDLFDEKGGRLTCVASLVDVSTTGASFKSTYVFKKGQFIRARLSILGKGVLDITGHIVRIKELSNYTQYAVAFDSAGAPKGK